MLQRRLSVHTLVCVCICLCKALFYFLILPICFLYFQLIPPIMEDLLCFMLTWKTFYASCSLVQSHICTGLVMGD